MDRFRIFGKVTNKENYGIDDVIVEAWDFDHDGNDEMLGRTRTLGGDFIIECDVVSFQDSLVDRWPDVYFKVFREIDGALLLDTRQDFFPNVKTEEMRDIILKV